MALRFEKKNFEYYPIDVDFTDQVPLSAASIDSVALSAVEYDRTDEGDTTDASPTVLHSTTGSVVDNTKARGLVKAGTAGKYYKISFKVTFDDGSKLQEDVTMKIIE